MCGCGIGFGKTHKVPEENTVATVDIPTGWKASGYAEGVEATSDDGEVYMAIEATDTQGVEKSIEEAIKYLKKKGVSAEPGSQQTKKTKLGEMQSLLVSWEGKDQDGAATIQLLIVEVKPDKGVLFIYWASPEGEKTHQSEITAITESLKKA